MPQARRLHPLAREALVERRQFLQGLGLGAAGLLGAGGASALLAGCGSDGEGAEGVVGAVSPATTALAYDDALPYWLQGNFAPVSEELTLTDLVVEGSLPSALTGLFVRNGSNPVTGKSDHWFLADGMLHGLRLDGGKASWYRNRYVQTPLLEAKAGLLGGGPPGGVNNQSNVSVVEHAGRLMALGEVGWPYVIDPTTLGTIGTFDYGGRLGSAMTAHPKVDPVTGRLHFFGYGFVPPYLTYYIAEPDGTIVQADEIAVAGPTMIHDFAITDGEAVFWELPVIFSLEAALGVGAGFPFQWQPSYGARIGVLPFGSPGSDVRWVEIDPCYVFHGVNAHRQGDDVVIDVCRQETMFAEGGDLEPSAVHRWTVGTAGESLTFNDEVVSDLQMDLPSIDRRRAGRSFRHAWFAEVQDDVPGGIEMAGVCHLDYETGEADRWDSAPGERVGEVVFAPGGDGEGEGWVMAFTYDTATQRSHLSVLDALDVAAGPVARVRIPARVPYGFHGWWLPDQAV